MREEGKEWLGIPVRTWERLSAAITDCGKVVDIIIYGSRAKETFRAFSDIDIALKGPELVHSDLFPIIDRIDELNLLYEIDLSLYSELDYPPLIREIDSCGRSLLRRLSRIVDSDLQA